MPITCRTPDCGGRPANKKKDSYCAVCLLRPIRVRPSRRLPLNLLAVNHHDQQKHCDPSYSYHDAERRKRGSHFIMNLARMEYLIIESVRSYYRASGALPLSSEQVCFLCEENVGFDTTGGGKVRTPYFIVQVPTDGNVHAYPVLPSRYHQSNTRHDIRVPYPENVETKRN